MSVDEDFRGVIKCTTVLPIYVDKSSEKRVNHGLEWERDSVIAEYQKKTSHAFGMARYKEGPLEHPRQVAEIDNLESESCR